MIGAGGRPTDRVEPILRWPLECRFAVKGAISCCSNAMAPPLRAVLQPIDDKSQPLDCTQLGKCGTITLDYKRHGITTKGRLRCI